MIAESESPGSRGWSDQFANGRYFRVPNAIVEVAASLADKTKTAIEANGTDSEKLRLMSRVFASETSRMTADSIAKIVYGTGVFSETEALDTMEKISYNQLICSSSSLIADMDRIADILFER